MENPDILKDEDRIKSMVEKLNKLQHELNGKTIKVEVEDGLGYELLSGEGKIENVDMRGGLFEFDITADAKKIGDGIYEYSPDDGVDEFETDKSGLLVVTKVPIGTYAITESFTPAGHAPEKQSITQTITSDTIEITYGNKKHFQSFTCTRHRTAFHRHYH